MVSIISFGLNLVELPAYKKDLPQCTAGYETWIMHHGSWIMKATLVEIGVYIDRYTVQYSVQLKSYFFFKIAKKCRVFTEKLLGQQFGVHFLELFVS